MDKIIATIKAIEEQTKKEINFISFYSNREVKEITSTVYDIRPIDNTAPERL